MLFDAVVPDVDEVLPDVAPEEDEAAVRLFSRF